MNDPYAAFRVTWLDRLGDIWPWFLVPAVFVGVGAFIGQSRGRLRLGCLLGLCLGPVGWLIVGLLSDRRAKCPECLGPVDPAAHKCPHCASAIPSMPVHPRP
jgi:hypothetical protein